MRTDPPDRLYFERRPAIGERWGLLGFVLILVGVVGLSAGIPGVLALLLLCGSGAASVISAWHIVPAFVRLRRLMRERQRERDRDRGE